jgi:hypothetical protein
MASTQVAEQQASHAGLSAKLSHSPRWLALWGASLLIVIGLLFYLVIDQRQLMKVDETVRENLLSGDTQKIDREFIRLQQAMYQQLLDKEAPALASLQEQTSNSVKSSVACAPRQESLKPSRRRPWK